MELKGSPANIAAVVLLVSIIGLGSCEGNSTDFGLPSTNQSNKVPLVVVSSTPPPAAPHTDQCGNTFCREDLSEICAQDRLTCVCPENKDRRRAEGGKCADVQDFLLPLLLVVKAQKSPQLAPNISFLDKNHSDYGSLVNMFEQGITNIFDRTATLSHDFIKVSVEKILRPTDVNRSMSTAEGGGLWLEFTARFVVAAGAANSTAALNATYVYNEMIRSIDSTPADRAIGGNDFSVDYYQPPFQCFRNMCPKNGLCLPVDDAGDQKLYKCGCPIGCRDMDSHGSAAGTVCSCPCDNPETNSCHEEYADCVPSGNNTNGYECKCKFGFVDGSHQDDQQLRSAGNGSGRAGERCILDRCIGQREQCGKKNATCAVVGDIGWECRCLDGFVDVRRSIGSEKSASSPVDDRSNGGGVICLRPQDVDRCQLDLHDCVAPAICAVNTPASSADENWYKCVCPDGSKVKPRAVCFSDTRSATCDRCSGHGTCVGSENSSTITCQCEEGYSGDDCSAKTAAVREATVWRIGGLEIEWSWIAFGIGSGIGVLFCLIILAMYKSIKRACRKKPTVRPSIDDEVFNFHEVARNVYGTGAVRESKLPATLRRSANGTPPPVLYTCDPVEGPYAVSDVGVSTFKRNGKTT